MPMRVVANAKDAEEKQDTNASAKNTEEAKAAEENAAAEKVRLASSILLHFLIDNLNTVLSS